MVGRCYFLILDGGGMLFFGCGWIFGLFLILGDSPEFDFVWSKPKPAEPEPEKMKILANPQKSKKVQKSIQNQKITSPHHPKSKNNIAPPRQKERVGAPWGPRGPPSLFGGVGRCYSLILDGGGMLFFDLGWIF